MATYRNVWTPRTALDDLFRGTVGDDLFRGGQGDDFITGAQGNDRLHGGGGEDIVAGEDGIDRLYGGDGNDLVQGDSADQIVDGGTGDDQIFIALLDFADEANTVTNVFGGAGVDSFDLLFWHDVLDTGDQGADRIVLRDYELGETLDFRIRSHDLEYDQAAARFFEVRQVLNPDGSESFDKVFVDGPAVEIIESNATFRGEAAVNIDVPFDGVREFRVTLAGWSVIDGELAPAGPDLQEFAGRTTLAEQPLDASLPQLV